MISLVFKTPLKTKDANFICQSCLFWLHTFGVKRGNVLTGSINKLNIYPSPRLYLRPGSLWSCPSLAALGLFLAPTDFNMLLIYCQMGNPPGLQSRPNDFRELKKIHVCILFFIFFPVESSLCENSAGLFLSLVKFWPETTGNRKWKQPTENDPI